MKKIKATCQSSTHSNIAEHYGLDVENELQKVLSEELAKEIDREILRSMGLEPDKNKRRMNAIKDLFK